MNETYSEVERRYLAAANNFLHLLNNHLQKTEQTVAQLSDRLEIPEGTLRGWRNEKKPRIPQQEALIKLVQEIPSLQAHVSEWNEIRNQFLARVYSENAKKTNTSNHKRSGRKSRTPASKKTRRSRLKNGSPEQVSKLSDDDIKKIINYNLSALMMPINTIEIIRTQKEVVCEGDQMRVINLALRLLAAFGIDEATIKRLQKSAGINASATILQGLLK